MKALANALRVLIGLSFSALVSIQVIAEEASWEGINWNSKKLFKLASQHPNLDQLIKNLPPGLRRNFTFVHDSNAKFQGASALYPRTLVFNNNLVLTFNGHADQVGYGTLEVLEFVDQTQKIDLYEVTWDTSGKAHPSAPNPGKCLECHSSDPKPIWSQYPNWPGFYGSNNDQLFGEELTQFKAFKNQITLEPAGRYANLIFPKSRGRETSPYLGPSFEGRPNLILGRLLTKFNGRRVVQKIIEDPALDRLMWLMPIVGPQAPCGYLSYQSTIVDDINDILESTARELSLPPAKNRLMQLMGLPEFVSTMSPVDNAFESEDGSAFYEDVVQVNLLRELREYNEDLYDRLLDRHDNHQEYYSANPIFKRIDQLGGTIDEAPTFTSFCWTLEEIAKKIIQRRLRPYSLDPLARQYGSPLAHAERIRVHRAIPLSCVECHTAQVGEGVQRFAFDNLDKLRTQLQAHPQWIQNIKNRIDPSQAGKKLMPPPKSSPYAPLSDKQQRQFIEFLEGLSQ